VNSFGATMNNVRIPLFLLLAVLISFSSTTRGQIRSRAKPAPKTSSQSSAAFDNLVKVGNETRIAGKLDEAIDAYTKAVRIRPKWPDGWWYIGAIYYEKDLYSQARDAFNNLVVLEPKRGPGWAMLGLCQFQTREYEQAVTSFQRGYTLGLNGNKELDSVVRYHAALLYIRLEQFEIAFDALREIQTDSPKFAEAFGLIMLRMPSLPSEIPAERRDEVLLAGKAGTSMAARRTDDARKAFEDLLVKYPDDPNVHYSFGVFMMHQDVDLAVKEFLRALELNAQHQPAMVQLAFEYLKRREYETALPLAEKSVALSPRMYPARNVLGRVLLELGQTARAITELEEGVRLAPASFEMHFALARAYARAGRKAEADRENEIFEKLQKKYNQQIGAGQTDSATSTTTVKPDPEKKN